MTLTYFDILNELDPNAQQIRVTDDPQTGLKPVYLDPELGQEMYFLSWKSDLFGDKPPTQEDLDKVLASDPVPVIQPGQIGWGRIELENGFNTNQLRLTILPFQEGSLQTNDPGIQLVGKGLRIPAGTWKLDATVSLYSRAQRACISLEIIDAPNENSTGERYTSSYSRGVSGHNETQASFSDILRVSEGNTIYVRARRLAASGTVQVINNSAVKSTLTLTRLV